MAVKPTPPIDRLLRRCVEDAKGCWIFQGALSEGYGKIGLGGKAAGIDFCHRVSYRHFIGEIPDGLDLDHLCRTRACCNPWHLEPVTRWVNANRGLRAAGYRLSHCKNGHEYTPDNVRQQGSQRRCLTCLRASARKSSTAYRSRKAAA